MSKDLFRRGGPHKIRKTGHDQYSLEISMPSDEYGRTARECTLGECSPGYFKVKGGTGITEEHNEAYCPYCRQANEPDEFMTKEQLRYAEDIVLKEVETGFSDMMSEALGLDRSGKRKLGGGFLSIEMSMEKSRPKPVRRPFEEELLRAVVCPHCSLDHAVFGLAIWCPDCGEDIFLEHVKAEYAVIRTILSDVARRRQTLGARIAARDIENCLEDVVSIFEAVLKAMLSRHLRIAGKSDEEIHSHFKKTVRNNFQNPEKAIKLIRDQMNIVLFDGQSPKAVEKLCATFEKRHPITHNLGVVDRKYLESAYAAEREGREVSVTIEEIEEAMTMCLKAFENLHAKAFANS